MDGKAEIDLLTCLEPHHGSDLWPLRLFHPLIRKPFPLYSSPAPGKNTCPPEYCGVLPAFLSGVLAPGNNSKMAKLDENFRQYRDILLSQDIRDIRSPPQDIQKIQDAGPSQNDFSSTMLSRYHVNFNDIHHATGKTPDGLNQTAGPHDREEGSYSGQGRLDRGSGRLGSERRGNSNFSGTEKMAETFGDFYGEAFLQTVTSASSFQGVKSKLGAGEEGVPAGSTPDAMTSDPNVVIPDAESCRDDDDVMENGGADHPSKSDEDRDKMDGLDQDLSFHDDPNTSKGGGGGGGDGERKEDNDESSNEEKSYSCPVCVFTTTDSLVFLPHVIHHCRQPRVGGPPYNPEDRKRRLSGGHLSHQPLGSSRKKGFHCKKCDFESEDKDIYYDHLASHIKIESRYSCVLCSFVTGLRHHITYHICNHYGIKSIRCNIDKCNYVCINQSMLKSHLKKHPLQACSRCHFTTKSNSEAEKHARETDHPVGINLRKADEMNNLQQHHSGRLGPHETPGRFYGVQHRTEIASRPERSFGVPLPPYLNPAAMVGNSFLHGLVSPLMWPGAMADGRGVMNQNSDHSFHNLGPDVSSSFPQSLMSQKQWAAQYANASDLYHQFLSFQKNFPSATVPPVSGFPPSTRVPDASPYSKKSLPGQFFNEASTEHSAKSSVSGELFESQNNMSRGGQKFLHDVSQCKENTITPLDLTKTQPSSEYTNTQLGENRPLSDRTGQQQLNEASASCGDAVMIPSKFCRRKGVARKVVLDHRSEDYARFALDNHPEISNCENAGRASSDGRPWSSGRPLSNGRPSSEGCVTSLVIDSWHARPSQKTRERSPVREDLEGRSALLDLISASETLLPVRSKPLRRPIEDQLKQAPSSRDRSPVSKDSGTKGEVEVSRSPAQNLPNTYDCGHCGIRFQDYILYSMHSGYHNFNNPLQCNFCGRKYDNSYEFYEHIGKVEHPES